MREYWRTYSLDELIRLVNEIYPNGFFDHAYERVKGGEPRDLQTEAEVARCLTNVIMQNYSDDSAPARNLQRIIGEVDRFAYLVSEVQGRLSELHAAVQEADAREAEEDAVSTNRESHSSRTLSDLN